MFVNLLSSVEIALSEVIKDQKIREGIVGSKIVVIPNGIDLDLYKVRKDIKEKFRNEMCDKYKIPKGCKILGCITRLTVEKGHTVLVNAARALMSESTNVRLRYIIVGDGVLRDKLKRLVKSSGLDALFIFTGQVSEEEKVKLLATFDLFVFPTLAEGFGISALEAMASGVPCIVSGLPILREVCGNSVEYFETGNPNDLKSVLKRSLEGGYRVPEADIKLQASKYDIKLFWEKYNSLYLI